MKKKIFYLLGLFVGLLFLTSCVSNNVIRPERDCPITKLLLDESSYPTGINLNEVVSPVSEQPDESAGQTGNYLGSLVFQNVIRYQSNEKAAERYDKWMNIAFKKTSLRIGSWETPALISVDVSSATQIYIACGDMEYSGYRCKMIGQYEEYFVYFVSDIIPDYGVSHEIFRDLVLEIDNQMASCLNQ